MVVPHWRSHQKSLLLVTCGLWACTGSVDSNTPGSGGSSASNGGGSNPGAGGSNNVAGSPGVGGSSPGAGGSSPGAFGGSNANGGMVGSNGGSSNGGTSASSGGANNSVGGSVNSGGSTSGGSNNASGGANNANGGANSGGRNNANGGTASGGSGNAQGGSTSAQGGSTSAQGGTGNGGGTSASGGTASGGSTSANGGSGAGTGGQSGACVPATCGSHKWACWKMPNPASSPTSVPNHQSLTDLGNGTVRDNITCLTWEKANPATQGNWQAAYNRCAALASSSYAGFNDWRMPTRVELASISDVTLGSTGFPKVFTVTSGYYVTGSFWYKTILTATGSSPEDRVWGYGTNGFTSNAIVRSNTNNLTRCVRGNGSGEAAGAYAVEPPNHYTVTGTGANATVTDNYTGLTWQQTYSSSRMAWSAAASYCASQSTGGLSGWRVPTLNELASTVNEALVAPAINRTVFPSTNGACDETGWFWAAEASKVGGTAWGLSYCDGYTGWNAGTSASAWNYFTDGYVRCVR